MRGDAGESQSTRQSSYESLTSLVVSFCSLNGATHGRSGCATPQRNSRAGGRIVASQAAQAEDEGDEDYNGEGCEGSPDLRRLISVDPTGATRVDLMRTRVVSGAAAGATAGEVPG
jgi:hypothetical protein